MTRSWSSFRAPQLVENVLVVALHDVEELSLLDHVGGGSRGEGEVGVAAGCAHVGLDQAGRRPVADICGAQFDAVHFGLPLRSSLVGGEDGTFGVGDVDLFGGDRLVEGVDRVEQLGFLGLQRVDLCGEAGLFGEYLVLAGAGLFDGEIFLSERRYDKGNRGERHRRYPSAKSAFTSCQANHQVCARHHLQGRLGPKPSQKLAPLGHPSCAWVRRRSSAGVDGRRAAALQASAKGNGRGATRRTDPSPAGRWPSR